MFHGKPRRITHVIPAVVSSYLRGKASALEAEVTVEERIHELLRPAKVFANSYLLNVFHEKASAEVMLSEKKRAYLNAGLAIKECKHAITSSKEATKYDGYGDECRGIYFAGVALFQDVEKKLVFPFCFKYSYETDEYKCYSKHFSDEIVENDFAYFIVENYEQSCRNVKEVLKRRE